MNMKQSVVPAYHSEDVSCYQALLLDITISMFPPRNHSSSHSYSLTVSQSRAPLLASLASKLRFF